ncbi:hypothetical protein GWK47_015621 [Chionoecetes opilio]|uniref:Uncharacterized protein n=1 Tax=Chionoecetes opilio TaxID=41210 RepID=A0A8J4XYW5_CHIOP|nr:hypothetical protein GWK47_015621 [Chionoecetes opilio]
MENIPPNARSPSAAPHCAQSTKLESGEPVIIVSKKPPTSEGFGWTLESATKTWRPVWVQPACGIPGPQRADQVVAKRHVHVWRTMLMQEGAVEVHITLQLPM